MALTFTPAPKANEICPDFKLPDLQGRLFSRADFFHGMPTLFMFICNHCPYVKAIEDRLIELTRDLQALKISVVAICSNDHPDDSLEKLRARAVEKKFPFVYLYDPDQKAALAFAAVCTPDFFLYDLDFNLRYRGRLDDSWKDASLVTQRELYQAA